jgi:redox-sensing transcriptional repressor
MSGDEYPPGGDRGRRPDADARRGAGESGELRGAASVPKPAAQRISLYLRYLEAVRAKGKETISSRELGTALGLTAAQVRKDLGHFGQFGFPGVGYKIGELIVQIRKILGTDRTWNVAIVGMGNLGSALARYRGFEKKGFEIAALFDADPRLVARNVQGIAVLPMEKLRSTVRARNIHLGILAVPAEAAQEVADRMVQAGIQGILNFAPRVLTLPDHVHVVTVDLAIQLEQLTLMLSLPPRP